MSALTTRLRPSALARYSAASAARRMAPGSRPTGDPDIHQDQIGAFLIGDAERVIRRRRGPDDCIAQLVQRATKVEGDDALILDDQESLRRMHQASIRAHGVVHRSDDRVHRHTLT